MQEGYINLALHSLDEYCSSFYRTLNSILFSFMSRNFKIRMAGSFGLTLCFLKVYSIVSMPRQYPPAFIICAVQKNPSPGPATHKKLLVRHKPGRTGVHAPQLEPRIVGRSLKGEFNNFHQRSWRFVQMREPLLKNKVSRQRGPLLAPNRDKSP